MRLPELLTYNLASVRAYFLREEFQRFWFYQSPAWAGKFCDDCIGRTLRSRLETMKREAATLRRHRELLLNWFRAKREISAGVLEVFNNKATLTIRKSYEFRADVAIETALIHNLGKLPEPRTTHQFCVRGRKKS